MLNDIVENVVYQRDVCGNIHAVSFFLNKENKIIELKTNEIFIENGDEIFFGVERNYKSLDNGKLNYLYITQKKKLYISYRAKIITSYWCELVRIFFIIGFMLFIFDCLTIIYNFYFEGEFYWRDQLDYFMSGDVIDLHIFIFLIVSFSFFCINRYNGSQFYLRKFIKIKARYIYLYEAKLCAWENDYFIYDFNKMNNFFSLQGIVEKIEIQGETLKISQQLNYQYIGYESDIDERKFIIWIEGKHYYFNVDYLDITLGSHIQFYCSKNSNEIFLLSTSEHYYIGLNFINLWSGNGVTLLIFKFLIIGVIIFFAVFSLIFFFIQGDLYLGLDFFILMMVNLIAWIVCISLLYLINIFFSNQYKFLKKALTKNIIQLLFFLWNAKKNAVDMGDGEKSQCCFHKK